MAEAAAEVPLPAGTAEVHLDSAILHRCCIQLSSSLHKDEIALEAEKQSVLPFITTHAALHTNEVTRALIWRVVDTSEEDVQDRIGAWELLHAVIQRCSDSQSELSRTPLADKISSFLPFLISHRWFTKVPRNSSSSSGEETFVGGSGGERNEEETGHHRSGKNNNKAEAGTGSSSGGKSKQQPWRAVLRETNVHKVIPASMVTGPADYSHIPVNFAEIESLTSRYHKILVEWKPIWRSDVYHQLKDIVRRTEREGNSLPPKAVSLFKIPNRYRDSLWRLRRRNPRPVIASHILYCYGWEAKRDKSFASNFYQSLRKTSFILPKTMAEAKESLDPTMHPTVLAWVQRLVDAKGGCLLCDTWRHEQSQCPCEKPFLRHMMVDPDSEEWNTAGSQHKRRNKALMTNVMEERLEEMSYISAVEILYRHKLHLPLRTEQVLDCVTTLIQKEMPYDEVLMAFDKVRGAITGALERHALWIHASYMLLPSKTLFDRPSDDRLSPALERAEGIFFSKRRYREWDQLLESVEVLDAVFKRARLPDPTSEAIDNIREFASFFFCLVDGSLPAVYTPGRYARVPDEVLRLASMKDVLCGCCLEPFRTSSQCFRCAKEPREPWDLKVARQLLESHQLLHIRLPEDEHKVEEAMDSIRNDPRSAKDFRQDELALAVKLVHERREVFCEHCVVMGHSSRRCEKAARRTLEREHLDFTDCRLDPSKIIRRLEDYRERVHRQRSATYRTREDEREEEAYRDLRDAFSLLVEPHLYPPAFAASIKELSNACIPLAAARYSTNAVQGFLLSINSSDLLQHLIPLRNQKFPEVCVYCDSVHHLSEDCHESMDVDSLVEEVQFLKELRQRGLNLWEYLQRRDYYNELLPTHHLKGRDSLVSLIQRFDEDYGPGGMARARFLEQNDLVLVSDVAGAAITLSNTAMLASQAGGLGSSYPKTSTVHGTSLISLGSQSVDGDQQSSIAVSGLPLSTSGKGAIGTQLFSSLYGSGGFSKLVSSQSLSLSSSAVGSRKRPRDDDDAEAVDGLSRDDSSTPVSAAEEITH